MLVAIISDLHDNLINLEKCLTWCRNKSIEKIICCGDVGNAETLNFLSNNYNNEIFLVTGNAETYEIDDLANLKNIRHCGKLGRESLAGLNYGFCHKPEEAKKIMQTKPAPAFIFYGHTHRPWLEKKGGIHLANPGNLAGIFYPATFAVLKTENRTLELKLIEKL